MRVHTVIFGGGAAGLWLLDELSRRNIPAVLLEAADLGTGQTIASQGILHGGLKYTLQGILTGSAAHIREMPRVWTECLTGRRDPDLTATRVRAEHCHLWRTGTMSSRLGMIGARIGLRVAPQSIPKSERPAPLVECPGAVARMDEQVVSPASFLENLAARRQDRILKIDAANGLKFELDGPGTVRAVALTRPASDRRASFEPDRVVFTAGGGNAGLRKLVGLSTDAMQRRPLHMVMLRGSLPELNGHCVDGAKTRVTITSDVDASGRAVWQVGGQLAEDGVDRSENDLLAHARSELSNVLPGVDLKNVEGATYRVDRAEASTAGGSRPETFQVLREGNVVTAWPTKLVLAPKLAVEIAESSTSSDLAFADFNPPVDWPRPTVAVPPWETCTNWKPLDKCKTSDAAA